VAAVSLAGTRRRSLVRRRAWAHRSRWGRQGGGEGRGGDGVVGGFEEVVVEEAESVGE
jgi:hypothetical protein